jgi:hypothetical protein
MKPGWEKVPLGIEIGRVKNGDIEGKKACW